MKQFDLRVLRQRLLGPTGYEFFLSDRVSEAREVGGLASSGHTFINQAIACVLVDLPDPARSLFAKGRDWINEAISSEERPDPYFPHGTEAIWYGDLALANWYLVRAEDKHLLDRCVDHQIEYLKTAVGVDPVAVDLVAVDLLLALRCDELFSLTSSSLKSGSLGRLRPESATALKWCEVGRDQSIHLVRDLLKKSSRNWVARGHYQRPVKWLRLLARPHEDPACTVKRVLDFI